MFLPQKIETCQSTNGFSEWFICCSCFHDARTIGKPSSYFNETFFSSHKKCCKFPLLPFYLGGLATNLSKSFPCRRAVQSTCSRIQAGVTNKYSCLFIGGQWQTQKLSQSTKLFLWSRCPGDCGLKWKSDLFFFFFLKNRKQKTPHTVHCYTVENISVLLKYSAWSTNRSVHRKCKNTLYFNQGT